MLKISQPPPTPSLERRGGKEGSIDDVWCKPHKTGALDGERESPLLLGIQAIALRRVHLPLRVEKATQEVCVFIIDCFQFLGEFLIHNSYGYSVNGLTGSKIILSTR